MPALAIPVYFRESLNSLEFSVAEAASTFETLCEQTDLELAVVQRTLNNLQLGNLIEVTTAGFRLCVNPDRLVYRTEGQFPANLRLSQP